MITNFKFKAFLIINNNTYYRTTKMKPVDVKSIYALDFTITGFILIVL